MIIAMFGLLLGSCVVGIVIWSLTRRPADCRPQAPVRRKGARSASPTDGRVDDHIVDSSMDPERSWTPLDEMQLVRLLRDAAP